MKERQQEKEKHPQWVPAPLASQDPRQVHHPVICRPIWEPNLRPLCGSGISEQGLKLHLCGCTTLLYYDSLQLSLFFNLPKGVCAC